MQNRFYNHITSEFSELLTEPFIIAISGGVDSVVLAYLCSNLKLNFALAHCNFKLRANESDKDAKFVEHLANKLNCKFFSKSFETELIAKTQKESIQVTARNLRYDWFRELINSSPYSYLLTAHHLDDCLETFVINLSRSTGIKGLTGIPRQNDFIRRPLLKCSKAEIKNYAEDHHIEWREDQSNGSTNYLRNKIRHQVIPALVDLNPLFLENFETTLNNLKQTEALLKEFSDIIALQVMTSKENQKEIDIPKLKSFKNTKAILYQILSDYGFTEWDDVYHLLEAQTGKRVESSAYQLIKDREKLILSPLASEVFKEITIDEGQENLNSGRLKFRFSNVDKLEKINPSVAYIDKAKLKFPLKVRSVQDGDYFVPFGMKGKKKLSDFLKDEKVSPHLKSSQLLLCNGNSEVIWVLNLRTDDRYKVEKTTQTIFKIEILDD